MRGNPDAVASAYSLDDYRIAEDLGGEARLREPARPGLGARHPARERHGAQPHGHRFALGHRAPRVVPVGAASRPTRSYTFNGPDLSPDARVGIVLEDHYWDDSDAAVVFKRVGPLDRRRRATSTTATTARASRGTTRRSSTSSTPEVREQVIQTILDVARRFPIIRFDAAMVLAKKHIQRLWWPEPGRPAAIPSRAEHAMPKAEFDRADAARVLARGRRPRRRRGARHAPAGRGVLAARGLLRPDARACTASTTARSCTCSATRTAPATGRSSRRRIEFDPEILKRYVNFMSNPDEKTGARAVRQGRQVLRRRDGDGDAARAADARATARSRASARSTGWSSAGRRSTSSRTRGWSSATSARSSRCSTGAPGSPRRATSCCTTS